MDRGRVGLDRCPNRTIRERHLKGVKSIHDARMKKIGKVRICDHVFYTINGLAHLITNLTTNTMQH